MHLKCRLIGIVTIDCNCTKPSLSNSCWFCSLRRFKGVTINDILLSSSLRAMRSSIQNDNVFPASVGAIPTTSFLSKSASAIWTWNQQAHFWNFFSTNLLILVMFHLELGLVLPIGGLWLDGIMICCCWNSGCMQACAMHCPHLFLFRFSLCCSYLCILGTCFMSLFALYIYN